MALALIGPEVAYQRWRPLGMLMALPYCVNAVRSRGSVKLLFGAP